MTARAFYEDGTLKTEESAYCWEPEDVWKYDNQEESYIIPQGWYESVSFAEEFAPIHNTVIAWRAIGKPYRPLLEE